MPPYLHLVRVNQMLGHGLDNHLKEEPGELKPGEVKERSNLFQYLAVSAPGGTNDSV